MYDNAAAVFLLLWSIASNAGCSIQLNQFEDSADLAIRILEETPDLDRCLSAAASQIDVQELELEDNDAVLRLELQIAEARVTKRSLASITTANARSRQKLEKSLETVRAKLRQEQEQYDMKEKEHTKVADNAERDNRKRVRSLERDLREVRQKLEDSETHNARLVTEIDKFKADSTEEERQRLKCPVCLQDEEMVAIDCGHMFCVGCLDGWQRARKSVFDLCSTCRRSSLIRIPLFR